MTGEPVDAGNATRVPIDNAAFASELDLHARWLAGGRPSSGPTRRAGFVGKRLTSQQVESLRDRDLRYADFRNADLADVDLPAGLNLAHADFSGARLHGARFGKVASLGSASFRGAEAVGVVFEGCANVGAVDFTAAILQGGDFRRTNLNESRFVGAELRGAKFEGAVLTHCDLSGADLIGATGIDLDLTRIKGALFSADCADRWLTLDRELTGVRCVPHVVGVALFVLPLAVQAILLQAVATAQRSSALANALTPPETANPQSVHLIEFLLGLREPDYGLAFLVLMLLLAYNAARGWLTWDTHCLRRDHVLAEGRSPARTRLDWPWRLRAVVHRLAWVAYSALALKVLLWLSASVAVPGDWPSIWRDWADLLRHASQSTP